MNRSELESLYRRLGPTIYRRCLRLLGESEMARDATQEVFLRALQQVEDLRDDRGCLPWLYRVSTRYCLDRLRQRQRDADRAPLVNDPSPHSPDLERVFASRQIVEQLLGGLDERSQQIAVYHFWDRMTQEEIAQLMELSRKTVGKRLQAVRAGAAALQAEINR